MKNVVIIFTTFPDAVTAEGVARTLVDEALIACATILPGAVSVYRWQGALERATEVQVLMKTSPSRVTETMARVTELHPYDVPECIAVDSTDGLPDYVEWVIRSTMPPDP